MKILGIDTSGKTASVAVCSEDCVLAETSVVTKLTHSQVILPLCKEMLKNAGVSLDEIGAIAVADGPGSYTGLRIGISGVKALSYALKVPCIGISTLESLAFNFQGLASATICAIMSARQDLVYSATFSPELERICEDRIISSECLFSELSGIEGNIILVGDGAEKFAAEYPSEKMRVAPPKLRVQLASSLCFAAFGKNLGTAEELNARYLQPTQAEKLRKN